MHLKCIKTPIYLCLGLLNSVLIVLNWRFWLNWSWICWVSIVYRLVVIQKWDKNSNWLCNFTDDTNGDGDKVLKWEGVFFLCCSCFWSPSCESTLFNICHVSVEWINIYFNTPIICDSLLNPCAFYHISQNPLCCVCLSLCVISVSATEVEGYSKTAGAWILSLNRNLYSVSSVAECAVRCDNEVAFTCRCNPLFFIFTFCIHTQ